MPQPLLSRFRYWLSTLVCCLAALLARAQSTPSDSFEHYRLTKSRLGSFEVHVSKAEDNARKPLLVYLDGSGNFPLYYKTKSGRYSTAVPLSVKRYAKQYRVVLISKPGIPFQDSLRYSSSGRSYYPDNATFQQHYSLNWRAETAAAAIDYVAKKLPIDQSKIVVMGFSEGSQVAPRVAVLNKKVTHVVCLAGNALNQLYDFLVEARLQVERQELTAEQGQQIVDSLYREYAKIYQAPQATDKSWFGATYQKWSSFSQPTPLESMLQLNIPILYIAGGKDHNQTIVTMDYARLEFLRRGKSNLTYRVFPNANHYFEEITTVDGAPKKVDRLDEVHQLALEWVEARPK